MAGYRKQKESNIDSPTAEEWTTATGRITEFALGLGENFAGREVIQSGLDWPIGRAVLPNHTDNFSRTAPVNMGNPNQYGILHLGGNVSEICMDVFRDNVPHFDANRIRPHVAGRENAICCQRQIMDFLRYYHDEAQFSVFSYK